MGAVGCAHADCVGMMMRRFVIVILSGLMFAGLAGCKEEERNRITLYQKGVYLGSQDTPLSEEQVRNLAVQTRNQAAW